MLVFFLYNFGQSLNHLIPRKMRIAFSVGWREFYGNGNLVSDERVHTQLLFLFRDTTAAFPSFVFDIQVED